MGFGESGSLENFQPTHASLKTANSLGVGYANRPKLGGVCGVFPYMRVCLALI